MSAGTMLEPAATSSPDPGDLSWASLGRLLVEAGHLTPEQLAAALVEKDRTGQRLGDLAVERGLISPVDLASLLGRQRGLLFVDLEAARIDEDATALVPEELARRCRAVAIGLDPDGTLVVGVADPTDLRAADDLRLALGVNLRLVAVDPEQLERTLARAYRRRIQLVGEASPAPADEPSRVVEIRDMASSAPTINLVNSILTRSIEEGASDIHFEPREDGLVVRIRVDGVLRDVVSIPSHMQQAVTSRIKIMGRLDIAERHVPQDGRATVHFGGEPLDLRVAVLPTRDGEHVVLRLAPRADRQRGIADLGMDEQSLSAFTRAIRQPFGAIVVCGPTGSGKTTTLYAALAELNDPGRMLATIEDPIEHRLPRVNQVEVNSRRGVTFARGLRTMLRSDPDVILVGEIRDEETAEIAVQAAMTGHLLLTSLHAPTAAGAIERLRDMGIDPRRLASSLNCIVAQRLARRLCDACKEPHETPAGELYQAKGCSACAGTGYRGRVALHEVLPVQGPIRKLVAEGSEKLFAEAVKQRMTTLREAGLRLCREGVCSLDELERVTGGRLV